MRVISNRFIGAALCLLLLSACAPSGVDPMSGVIRVGVATEPYPPFSIKNASGQWVGFEIDLARAVCDAAHLTCEVTEVYWDHIIPALVDKRIDVIWSSMSVTSERRKIIDFTDVYYESIYVVIGHSSDATIPDIANPSTLTGKIIGVQTATVSAAFIQRYFGGIAEVRLYDSLDNALADLKARRLDYVPEFMVFLRPFLEENPAFTVKTVWPTDPILAPGVAAGVRQDDTGLKERLNDGIAAVVGSGRYDEILKRYQGLDQEIRKPSI